MEACSLLVNLRKGMQGSSEQPLVGEEHCVTTLITAAKETRHQWERLSIILLKFGSLKTKSHRIPVQIITTQFKPELLYSR